MPESDDPHDPQVSGYHGHQHVENHIALSDGGVKWLVIFLIALICSLFTACAVAIMAHDDVKALSERVGQLQDRADRVDIWGQETSAQLDRLEIPHKPYPKGR